MKIIREELLKSVFNESTGVEVALPTLCSSWQNRWTKFMATEAQGRIATMAIVILFFDNTYNLGAFTVRGRGAGADLTATRTWPESNNNHAICGANNGFGTTWLDGANIPQSGRTIVDGGDALHVFIKPTQATNMPEAFQPFLTLRITEPTSFDNTLTLEKILVQFVAEGA